MTRHFTTVAIIVLLALFAAASLRIAWTTSATSDEPVHFAAGYSYLLTGDYRLNPEHPPLLKILAALPAFALDPWPRNLSDHGPAAQAFFVLRSAWDSAATNRDAQWIFGKMFLYGLTDEAVVRHRTSIDALPTTTKFAPSDFVNDARTLIRSARAVIVFLGVCLGVVIFLWAREAWGNAGGLVAVLLYTADPNFIAHSAMVTTDVGVTLFMTLSLYTFWRLLRKPSAGRVLLFAVCVALAAVSKHSAVLLVLMIVPLLAGQLLERGTPVARRVAVAAVAGVAALVITLVTIWGIYGFREADRTIVMEARERSDRFLPRPYAFGLEWAIASATPRQTFLNGDFYWTGVRTYFLWTTVYKLPLPLLAFLAVALPWAVVRRPRHAIPLLLAGLVYFGVAMSGNVNIGHRHVLPAFPPIYVAAAAIATWFDANRKRRRLLAGIAAAILISSHVVFAPSPQLMFGRHLSYMNELGGGPRRGYQSLLDSNFDWGQDLPQLAAWYEEQRTERPFDLVYFGSADPRYYGIRYHERSSKFPPGEGILAISANHYMGLFDSDDRMFWRRWLAERGATQVGTAGDSILLFEIPPAH